MVNQKHIISIFFFAFLIFVLFQLYLICMPLFHALFWASVLTYAFFPLHRKIQEFARHPGLAALITTLIIVLIVIVPAFFMMQKLLAQTVQFYSFIREGGLYQIYESLQREPHVQALTARLREQDIFPIRLSDLVNRLGKTFANTAASQVATATKNALAILANAVLTVFLLFFFLRDGRKIYQYVYDLAPLETSDKPLIFGKINDTLAGVVRGQVLTSIAQGTASGIVYALLGLPAPHFLGFLTFLATLVPLAGTTVVWVPLAGYLFATQAYAKGAILTVVGIFFISAIDNVLKPIIIGERAKIPVFLLFIAVLGGLKVYGVTGIFLGPLFIALFFALIKIYQARYRDREAVS